MALTENTISNKSEKKSQESSSKSNDKDRREKPLSKVIIRRLPPGIKQEEFLTQVSPIPDYDYIYTVKGDMSLGENSFSRVYINFCNIDDLYIFKEKFDNYVFIDLKGHEYPAVVEYSSFQKVPKRRKARADPKIGSIESDPLYTEFLESLKELPNQEEKPEYSYQPSSENKNDRTTPLLDYLKQRKVDRLRIREEKREERRKKEIDRKKYREDDRRKYRDDDRKKYRDDDDRKKHRDDDDRKKYRDEDDHKKYRSDDDRKKNKDDDYKKYRDDYKKHFDEKISSKNNLIKSSSSSKDIELKENDSKQVIVNNQINIIEDTESNNKEKIVEDILEKDGEKPYFKNSKDRKYEDKKPIGVKPKSKFSSRSDRYDDKRDYKFRREDYHKNKYEDNKKYEPKEYPKKVKKYSERREERKIEAKKAEQKSEDVEDTEEKGKLENDMQESKFEEKVEYKSSPEKKSSKSSEERFDDGDVESKHRNKENDPRMQRRIRNKDRPTMAIYKPGMLRKKSVDNDPKDFKDDLEKEMSSAKEEE